MEKYLGERGGASSEDAGRMVSYLTSIVHGHVPPSQLGARSSREMRTLAEALDALKGGRLPQLADLLMQRFKSLEVAALDGNWAVASKLELVPEAPLGLASPEERLAAQAAQRQAIKLKDGTRRMSGGRGADG